MRGSRRAGAAHRVLGFAVCVLRPAFQLLDAALCLRLRIADPLSGLALGSAKRLVRLALDSVFIHLFTSVLYVTLRPGVRKRISTLLQRRRHVKPRAFVP